MASELNWRDRLYMKLMGMRQFVRDMPEHEGPEIERLVEQLEWLLRRMCEQGKSNRAGS